MMIPIRLTLKSFIYLIFTNIQSNNDRKHTPISETKPQPNKMWKFMPHLLFVYTTGFTSPGQRHHIAMAISHECAQHTIKLFQNYFFLSPTFYPTLVSTPSTPSFIFVLNPLFSRLFSRTRPPPWFKHTRPSSTVKSKMGGSTPPSSPDPQDVTVSRSPPWLQTGQELVSACLHGWLFIKTSSWACSYQEW